jgi:c(7)-type cytochrome triheme protein
VGKKIRKEYDYVLFTEKLPRKGIGRLIDWEDAEARGLIQPIDFLPGVSVKRPPLTAQKDFSILSRGWMSDIIFSHKKHALWNGCEVCHPDIFPSVKKGKLKYSMFQICDGQYCGVCHDHVAFPLNDCQRCHANPVRR